MLEKGRILDDGGVGETVKKILDNVYAGKDEAVLAYCNQYEGLNAKKASDLLVSKTRISKAKKAITQQQRDALIQAAKRIKQYHKKQLAKSGKDWTYSEADGTVLGQKVSPLDRVGLYVPGGKAAYPSTVLMTAIPAKVAGVSEVIMVTPAKNGEINNMVLAAAAIAGVDKIFTIGGAQAIGALAYGTQTVPKVDKIVGPGNVYVAEAKRQMFGEVDIDMIAGPSEILVICDGKTDAGWIALDLLSQAEHDQLARCFLVSPDGNFLDQVEAEINRILPTLERQEIASAALNNSDPLRIRSAFIKVNTLEDAVAVSNLIAPEHLELAVENPQALLPKIKHAGAIFIGKYTSEALGDYVAGPSHVLPTSGTARFSSPLGVYDFQKRSSIIQCSAQGASGLGKIASVLARGESLTAHARSAEARIKK